MRFKAIRDSQLLEGIATYHRVVRHARQQGRRVATSSTPFLHLLSTLSFRPKNHSGIDNGSTRLSSPFYTHHLTPDRCKQEKERKEKGTGARETRAWNEESEEKWGLESERRNSIDRNHCYCQPRAFTWSQGSRKMRGRAILEARRKIISDLESLKTRWKKPSLLHKRGSRSAWNNEGLDTFWQRWILVHYG